jgi:uncharacterized protein YybS (DUF2232 family)
MPKSDRDNFFSASDSEPNWVDMGEDSNNSDNADSYAPKSPPESKSRHKDRKNASPALVLVETAFLASTASLIWLINYYFPLGPLLKIFFPIPIALVYVRWGNRAAWMSAIVSSLLLSILMGPTRSIIFFLPYGLMGVQLGACWCRRSSWYVSISFGALIGTIGFFFRFWLLSILLGEDLWLYTIVQVTNILNWIFLKLGILATPDFAAIQVIGFLMVCLNNLIYLFVVHLVALLLLDRLGNPIPRPPNWVNVLFDYE